MTSMSESYGLLAEFADAEVLRRAARSLREEGYSRIDAFTPFAVEGLDDAIGADSGGLPWLVLAGGCLGGAAGYALQYYASVVDYPLNVGGRPYHSWPAFVPLTFELAILGAALTAVAGMLLLNGLPRPYHPLFNVERFDLATRNRFFLCVESADPLYDEARLRRKLTALGSRRTCEVPW